MEHVWHDAEHRARSIYNHILAILLLQYHLSANEHRRSGIGIQDFQKRRIIRQLASRPYFMHKLGTIIGQQKTKGFFEKAK